jgi:ribosomal protein S6
MARPQKLEEVARWLRSYLAQGSRLDYEVKAAAAGRSISLSTLNRAKFKVGVESVKRGTNFYWRDPEVFEEQTGSTNLVAAIDRLARQIERLSERGLPLNPNTAVIDATTTDEPAVAEPTTNEPATEDDFEVFEMSSGFEAWSDVDFESATQDEIAKYIEDFGKDLNAAKKVHGTDANANKFGEEERVINNTAKMKMYNKEIKRACGWMKKGAAMQTQNFETMELGELAKLINEQTDGLRTLEKYASTEKKIIADMQARLGVANAVYDKRAKEARTF